MGIIKRNILANMGGRAWSNLISLLFIPVYLHFLGIDNYGLVGFWITLVSVLSILDLGMGLTLNREMARLSTDSRNNGLMWDTLKSFETIYWTLSLSFGALLWFAAPIIAKDWLNTANIPVESVTLSIRIMSAVFLFQFPFALYQGGLMGLQHQVLASAIQAGFGSLRGVLASVVLWLVSPTVEAFFYCQLIVSLLQTVFAATMLKKHLPPCDRRPVFKRSVCRSLYGYALGISGNTILGLILTQLDKVILSKILPLDKFGYYTIAWTVAAALWTIIQPFGQALFPRFAQLADENDSLRLTELYHRTGQFIASVLLPVAVTIIFFSREIVLLWTQDPEIADNTHLIVSLLAAGTALNGLASLPMTLQFASGWPKLMVYTNFVAVIVLAPMIYFLSKLYGGAGAAAAWVALNAGYMLFNVPLMHRKLLQGELWKWYFYDVGRPIFVAVLVGWLIRLAAPAGLSMPGMVCFIVSSLLACLVICAIQSRPVREYAMTRIHELRQS